MAETSASERARIITWEGMLEGDDVLCGGVAMLMYAARVLIVIGVDCSDD